ncbi:DUF305 domain-containing protein [Bosea sp. NPDC055353]
MRRIALASLAIVCGTAGAWAQPASKPPMGTDMPMMMQPNSSDSAATKGYKAAMMGMIKTMPSFSGDADVDFMKQMRSHHQGAIDMAKVVLANGKDSQVKALANEIVSAQEKEIATIDQWLKAKGR